MPFSDDTFTPPIAPLPDALERVIDRLIEQSNLTTMPEWEAYKAQHREIVALDPLLLRAERADDPMTLLDEAAVDLVTATQGHWLRCGVALGLAVGAGT